MAAAAAPAPGGPPRPSALDAAVATLAASRAILVIAGAGISTTCGVPDFRSEDGLYAALQRAAAAAAGEGDGGALPFGDPQELFTLSVFQEEPELFYSVARVLYPEHEGGAAGEAAPEGDDTARGGGALSPSLTHRFLAALHRSGRLLRVYTQNVDCLEVAAGLPPDRVVACHGRLDRVTCLGCRARRPASDPAFREAVAAGAVARCGRAGCAGVLKPDAVFFGEPLPPAYADALAPDLAAADCLLVVGSSLQVRPVSGMPDALAQASRRGHPAGGAAPSVFTVLVNLDALPGRAFDAELLGPADVACEALWRGLCLPGLPAALAAVGAAPADVTADAGARSSRGEGEGPPVRPAAAASGGEWGDIAVEEDAPGRCRLSCARHDRAAAAARARMRQRVDRALQLAVGAAGGGGAGSHVSSTRSGRQVKRPRR